MKRMVMFICVLCLMFDMTDDSCLGKAKFNLPQSTAKTRVTSSDHPNSGQTDFRSELAAADLPGSPPRSTSNR